MRTVPKSLVVCANPGKKSFCKALAGTVIRTLKAAGYIVVCHDLYDEKFPPILAWGESKGKSPPPPIIRQHCEDLANADLIVVIHPNWWGMPPAVMTGWIDRVFRPGVAYKFEEGDAGEGVPQGLLKAKAGIVFNTSDTKKEREHRDFGDPLDLIWKNCVFGLCGVRKVVRKTFGVIVTSTLKQRKAWLDEAALIVRRCAENI